MHMLEIVVLMQFVCIAQSYRTVVFGMCVCVTPARADFVWRDLLLANRKLNARVHCLVAWTCDDVLATTTQLHVFNADVQ